MVISVIWSGLEVGRTFTCSLAFFSGLLSLGMGIGVACQSIQRARSTVTFERRG
jgi:hypothetical protein